MKNSRLTMGIEFAKWSSLNTHELNGKKLSNWKKPIEDRGIWSYRKKLTLYRLHNASKKSFVLKSFSLIISFFVSFCKCSTNKTFPKKEGTALNEKEQRKFDYYFTKGSILKFKVNMMRHLTIYNIVIPSIQPMPMC